MKWLRLKPYELCAGLDAGASHKVEENFPRAPAPVKIEPYKRVACVAGGPAGAPGRGLERERSLHVSHFSKCVQCAQARESRPAPTELGACHSAPLKFRLRVFGPLTITPHVFA